MSKVLSHPALISISGMVIATTLFSIAACQPPPTKPDKKAPTASSTETKGTPKDLDELSATRRTPAEAAPKPSARLEPTANAADLTKRIGTYFSNHIGRRIHIQTDKPLYKPGETIWIKTWDLETRNLQGGAARPFTQYALISPKGAAVLRKSVQPQEGMATNDFIIPETVQGGLYQIRVTTQDGKKAERPIVVSTYEAPRIKKKLEFVRKAYGPGDEVSASIKIKRPTGEPMGNHPLRGQIQLDGQALDPVRAKTNKHGGAVIKFKLPEQIQAGDGILSVLVSDGGITESISKRIPIVLKKIQLSMFPEGGHLIAGMENRLYFEAKNTIGKAADIEGQIVDDMGNVMAKLRTYKFGLGRVTFTPATGRQYKIQITRPVGVTERYSVPLASDNGCLLRTYDDLDGEKAELRIAVRCTAAQTLTVVGMMRENLLDSARVQVMEGKPSVVYLKAKDEAMAQAPGVARVTVFNDKLEPLAERVVFRNRRNTLQVKLETDEKRYSPREQVALTVRTLDVTGKPVPAEITVAVVDDTVISFADDKTGHMLSKLLLEPELPGKIEEPNFFFDLKEGKSALALELLMGARGYRRFEWRQVLNATSLQGIGTAGVGHFRNGSGARPRAGKGRRAGRDLAKVARKGGPRPKAAIAPRPPAAEAAPMARPRPPAAPPAPAMKAELKENAAVVAPREMQAREAEPRRRQKVKKRALRRPRREPADGFILGDKEVDADWADAADKQDAWASVAAVRVFPAPTYTGAFSGVRTDFRETIHWAPRVRTDKKGKAIVTFYLSDAISSFRVFAESVGAQNVGRAEKTFKSSLPFSMNVKLPLEVSAGDRMQLPLTLTNDREEALDVKLHASFGEHLTPDNPVHFAPSLAANKRESLFYPLTVTGQHGKSVVRFAADAGGLKDEFKREVNVVPLGFPQSISKSGQLARKESLSFDLGEALDGTKEAKLTVYTSPTSTLLTGLDGMIRQPYGCFEQTSSSNYPNIMVMDYLRTNNVADPELVSRISDVLDKGYKRLVGFETKTKGYEWFGRAPAHEALTAYGVLEFADMKRVYGNVDEQMLTRTVDYLKSRRNGKGGFKRDAKALDSFGRANPEFTDAYIVYAMTEAGFTDMIVEINHQAQVAKTTNDPYLLALAVNTLLNVPTKRVEGKAAAHRLAKMQAKDGQWLGKVHSITRSTGRNLEVETTGLSLLALMKTDKHEGPIRKGIGWLVKARGGYGTWGATQATVLALKALTTYSTQSRKMKGSGTVVLKVNGQVVAERSYEAGQRDPVEIPVPDQYFSAGANTVELVHSGKEPLPYSIAVDFRATKPASDPKTVIGLETRLNKSALKMGETLRLTARITNKTKQGQPMTLARIGFPGGLSFQTWQLKELKEKNLIAFYETRAREIVLYFRDMKPEEVKEIPLELVATVPGHYTGPASRAYLYYTDDQKVWADPLKISVTR